MKVLFWTLLIWAFAMGIYACWPVEAQETRLLSVYEIQTELVRRGHNIKVDGKFGKNTDLALNIEITKQGE